jgi:hypothetical protein
MLPEALAPDAGALPELAMLPATLLPEVAVLPATLLPEVAALPDAPLAGLRPVLPLWAPGLPEVDALPLDLLIPHSVEQRSAAPTKRG